MSDNSTAKTIDSIENITDTETEISEDIQSLETEGEGEIIEAETDSEEADEHADDNALDRQLRKLNPKYKSKGDLARARAALSELEYEGYTPEDHEAVYDVGVITKVYSNNFAVAAVLFLIGIVLFPYSKTATGLLWFYAGGVSWMAIKGIRTKVHVDHDTFTVTGVKYAGTYKFEDVDKIIYTYNKRDQRRYWIYIDGRKTFEIPPGAINSRWLYDDMIGWGVPGGWYNKL